MKYEIVLENNTVLNGTFSDEEWNILDLYYKNTKRLNSCSYLQAKKQLHIGFDFQNGETSSGFPTSEELFALLHCLRPFILENETSSFHKALNVIGKLYKNVPEITDFLKGLRDDFGGKNSINFFISSLEILDIDDIKNANKLNSDKMLFLWLNAKEFHQGQKELKSFNEIVGGAEEYVIKTFVIYLMQKISAIYSYANFIYKIRVEK